jgi:hypothetical protein
MLYIFPDSALFLVLKEIRNRKGEKKIVYRFVIDPEWHPWDDDDHEAGDVDGDDEEGQLTSERQFNSQTTVSTCKKKQKQKHFQMWR